MTNRFTRIAICLSFTATALLATPGLVLAATPTPAPVEDAAVLTTTAIPPRLEILGKPGETIQKTMKVQNGATVTQYYTSDIEDFIVSNDGKTPLPVRESTSSRYSLAKWVTVSPTRFVLKPNGSQTIDILIQIPKDALPGGHYAMVLHQPDSTAHKPGEALLASGSTGTAMRTGTLLYVTVAGDIHEEAFIRNFKAPSFVEFGPVTMTYDVENRSDVHIRPQSSIEVKDIFGRTMEKIKPDELNIFPLTTRGFSASYSHYWGLGKYTASLTVPYGTHGSMTAASLSFWIIPYRLIVGLMMLAGAFVAAGIVIRRFFLHRADSKTKEIEALKKKVEELESKDQDKA